jgi:hypothetical protein
MIKFKLITIGQRKRISLESWKLDMCSVPEYILVYHPWWDEERRRHLDT